MLKKLRNSTGEEQEKRESSSPIHKRGELHLKRHTQTRPKSRPPGGSQPWDANFPGCMIQVEHQLCCIIVASDKYRVSARNNRSGGSDKNWGRVTINLGMLFIRCLMVSTDQADPSCFYSRISWILMDQHWFYFFHPLHLVQGLRSNKIKSVITTSLFKLGKS